jgi:hypothetical protein
VLRRLLDIAVARGLPPAPRPARVRRANGTNRELLIGEHGRQSDQPPARGLVDLATDTRRRRGAAFGDAIEHLALAAPRPGHRSEIAVEQEGLLWGRDGRMRAEQALQPGGAGALGTDDVGIRHGASSVRSR